MQQNDVLAATISFDIHAEMSSEQAVKEMYNKVASSNHTSKALMQSYIMIALSYDSVCSTTRADATAAGIAYVPYTFAQYGTLIDRGAHAAHTHTDSHRLIHTHTHTHTLAHTQTHTHTHTNTHTNPHHHTHTWREGESV